MHARVVVAILALALAGCSSSGGGAGASDCVDLTDEGPVFIVRMTNSKFLPDCFSASASQSIRLVNEDEDTHTFTMLNTPIDVVVGSGETFSGDPVTGIVEPGEYRLICRFHELMEGRVTVVA
jgi:plastocyanin